MASVQGTSFRAAPSLRRIGTSKHIHGPNCGHLAIQLGGRIGFLVDAQLEWAAATKDFSGAHDPVSVDPAAPSYELQYARTLSRSITRNFTLRKNVDLSALPASMDGCTPSSPMAGAEASGGNSDHLHSHSCGHELIPHGDHYDYLVPTPDGYRLEHQHAASDGRSAHVDTHGRLIRCELPGSDINRIKEEDVQAASTVQQLGGRVAAVAGEKSHVPGGSGRELAIERTSSAPALSPPRASLFRFVSGGNLSLTSRPILPGDSASEFGDVLAKASLLRREDHPEMVDEGDLTLPVHGASILRTAKACSSISSAGSQRGGMGDSTRASDVVVDVAQGGAAVAPGPQGPTRLVLTVNGICCPSEVPLIERILMALPGVESVTVTVPTRRTVVMHEPDKVTASAIVDALNDAGLDAFIYKVGDEGGSLGHRFPPWDTLLSGLLIAISLFSPLCHPLEYVALGAVALRLPRMAVKLLASLRRCVLDVNTLMVIAVGGAIAIREYIEAGTVVFLFALAEWLELRASEKSRRAMSAMLALAPEQATLAATGETLPVEEICVGVRLVVKPGDKLPIDGIVLSGSSSVTEANLTGESRPVAKWRGSRVFAGTINQTGAFTMQTTALARDSAIARMVRLVEEAQTQRTKSERVVESFAKFYTPAVVLAAALVVVIPVATGHHYKDWLYLALVLLVVACPCALVISTPVTAVCGLAQAARLGVLVKGGTHLETLGRVRELAVDKTGTLTEGQFRVRHMELVALAGDGIGTAVSGNDLGTVIGTPVASQVNPFQAGGDAQELDHTAPGGGGNDDREGRVGSGVNNSTRVRGPSRSGNSSSSINNNNNYVNSGSDSMTLPRALYWLSAVESRSSHPLAGALVTFAKKNGVETGGASVEDFTVLPGVGVCATVDGCDVFVGNNDLADEMGWWDQAGPGTLDKVEAWEDEGGTVGWVGFEGRPLAVFSLADMPRKEAGDAVARLKSLGVSVTMLTGDGWGAARAVARQVGLEESRVHAALHPEHKVARVQELKAALPKRGRNKLAMVGDGINDAPALAAADLGVAMGVGGTAVAMETGDVALMTNDLTRLADAVELGRSVRMTVIANIVFSVVCKLAFIGITLAGWTTLWMAVLADVGTSLAVTYNSTRVLKSRQHGRSASSAHGDCGGCGDKDKGGCGSEGHAGHTHGQGHGQAPGHGHDHRHAHGHGHGLSAVLSRLRRCCGHHGHAHGAGSCGAGKEKACHVPLSSEGGCGQEDKHAGCAPVLLGVEPGQGCCANDARDIRADLVLTIAAPESGCCESKACGHGPGTVVAAAPGHAGHAHGHGHEHGHTHEHGHSHGHGHGHRLGGVFSRLWRRGGHHGHAHAGGGCGGQKQTCCQPPINWADSHHQEDKCCSSAPVLSGVELGQGCCASKACARPVAAATAAPRSDCCASKACAHDGPGPVAAAAPKLECCASKACYAHDGPGPVAAAAPKLECCASKACYAHDGPGPVAAAAAPKLDCCASKACCAHDGPSSVAADAAAAAAAATKSDCCASKACCAHDGPGPVVAAAASPKSNHCAGKSCGC
eukprot:jgi/Mesvir1/9644/Mv12139-RA.1